MEPSAMQVIDPVTRIVVIQRHKVEIGELSCKRLNRALKFLQLSAVKISQGPVGSDADFVLKIFQDLDENVGDLVAIITGLPPEVTSEVSLGELSRLAVAICETNDFGEIFSNFIRVLELSKPKK